MEDRRNTGAKIQRKRPRRRSHTRKIPIDSFMNMAEVRREIVSALQLHRSSTSIPSSRDDLNMSNMMSSHQQCYPSSDGSSIAVSEPIWSTTAPPTVLAVPPPAAAAAAAGEVLVEFEWPESLSSSYTWWSSFLNSLEGKTSTKEMSNYSSSYVEDINMHVENPKVYEQSSSCPVLEANDDQNPYPDEWLIVPPPAAEDSSELL